MDSGGKPGGYTKTSESDASNLSRTVSFPNFLRGFWDHHHGTDSISHSVVNSKAASTYHLAESDAMETAPDIKNINQPAQAPSSADQKFSQSTTAPTVDNDAAASSKLNRCDTWAGFNAPTVVENQPTQNASIASQNPDNVSKTLDALHLTTPSAPTATVPPSLPRIHDRAMPDSRPHHSSLLAALFHHDLSRPTLPSQHTTIDGKVVSVGPSASTASLPHFAAHDQPHDRNGMFGLPSRVKVTGRELNMMSPISF